MEAKICKLPIRDPYELPDQILLFPIEVLCQVTEAIAMMSLWYGFHQSLLCINIKSISFQLSRLASKQETKMNYPCSLAP